MRPVLELTLVALICPDVLQAGQGGAHLREEGLAAPAVVLVCREDLDAGQQAGSLDQRVALAAVQLLVPVVAADPPFSLVRTDWLSRMAAVGFASLSILRRVRSRSSGWMRSQVPPTHHLRK